MNVANQKQNEQELKRAQIIRDEFVKRIAASLSRDGVIEPLPGLHLARLSTPMEKMHSVIEPSFCVIAQGSKAVFVGDSRYQYDPFNYLLATIELPWVSQVLEASREHPYLSFRLVLEPNLVSSVMVESGHIMPSNKINIRAIDVGSLDVALLDAVVRLIRLVNSPTEEAKMLMPLIKREIIYRLLTSEQGSRLCHLALSGSYTSNIAKAVERFRHNFDQTIRVEEIAQELGMSASSFHQHFKSVTAMSPMQFQKRLRLQEARRLMLGEDLDATSAAYRVGYNDPSHFSREYKSLFGAPPLRDVERLREALG